MADMLSRARLDDEDDMVSEDEEVGVDFFEAAYVATRRGGALRHLTNSTRASTTESGSRSAGS